MPSAPLIRLWSAPTEPRGHRPLTYSIDAALAMIFIDLLAIDDAPLVIQALQQIRLNPHFKRGLSACVDCRYIEHAPSPNDLRALAELWPRSATRDLSGRCAIIAPSAWSFRGAQAFVALSKVRIDRVRVFSACADALVWLGVGRSRQHQGRHVSPCSLPPSADEITDDAAQAERAERAASPVL
jgi:hypothetical protein